MSSEQSVTLPTATSHSATRREKKQAERLARAQAVTQQATPAKTLTVFAGDPGTYTDPDPMNTAGWTTIRRGKGY